MSERSKERRRLAQQQLRKRREQAEQQLHDRHDTAEQASKLHVLLQLMHQTLLSDTTATRQAFKHAVEDETITNDYLVHLNTSGHEYSGIAASILHQRKYVKKSYNGDIKYKGKYAGAFTTWDNEDCNNLHIDGDFAFMHATVDGVNMFNKARFTGNNIFFGAKIKCENFANRSVVHGHGFCAHTEVTVTEFCMSKSKVVGSNCFESSKIQGDVLFHKIKIKGDYFAKKAVIEGGTIFVWSKIVGDHNLWECTIKATNKAFFFSTIKGNAFANHCNITADELLTRCRIKGNNNLWHCSILAENVLSNVTIIGNAFANYSRITSTDVFNKYRSFGAHFCRGSNIEGHGMTGYVYGTNDKVLLNGKEVRPVAPRSAYDQWSSKVLEESSRPFPMILQVTTLFMLPVFLLRGIAYITNHARGIAVARKHKDKHL